MSKGRVDAQSLRNYLQNDVFQLVAVCRLQHVLHAVTARPPLK